MNTKLVINNCSDKKISFKIQSKVTKIRVTFILANGFLFNYFSGRPLIQ